MNPDIQKQIDEIKARLDELNYSSDIPRDVETALTERLGTNVLGATASGTPLSSTNKIEDQADTGLTGLSKLLRLDSAGKITTSTIDTGTGVGQIIQVDGSGKLPAVDGSQLTNLPASKLLTTAPSTQTSTNDSENSFLSFTLPANSLGTSHVVRIRGAIQVGLITNVATITHIKLKYGSSTVVDAGTINFADGSNNAFFGIFECHLYASGATNTQYGTVAIVSQSNGTNTNISGGSYAATTTSAEDSTASKTVAVTFQTGSRGGGNGYGITITGITAELLA